MNLVKPYLIGIAGGSASGKTYLLNALLNHFNADEICLISQDHYYKPQAEQHIDENGQINYDLPEGIDQEKLMADIQSLLSGKPVKKLEYTLNNINLHGNNWSLSIIFSRMEIFCFLS